MSFYPAYSPSSITNTAQNLQFYLENPNTQDLVLPAFNMSHLEEAIQRISTELEEASTHADIFEEAAHRARQKTAHLHSALGRYRNLSVPIVRLPTELLTVIFRHCVDADGAGHVLSPYAMPWALAQTCRRFRETALATPSLWRVVRFNSNVVGTGRCHDEAVNMLRVWLERSQTHPISCLAMFDDSKSMIFHRQVLELLITHSERWDAVDLDFGHQTDLYYALSIISRKFPVLYSCRFKVIFQSQAQHSGDRVLTRLDAPHLREAAFFVLSESNAGIPEIIPPWSQLESLAWFPDTPRLFLDVAPSLSLLRHCYLIISQNARLDNIQRIVLLNLRRLDIFGPFEGVIAILNRLTLPSLEDLELDFEEYIGAASDHILLCLGKLQVRSQCRMRHLSSALALFSSRNAPLLAEKIGTVNELRVFISSTEDVEQAIDNFTKPNIFRGLRTLHLLFRERPSDDLALFSRVVDIVEYRRSGHTGFVPLETLSLDMIRSSPSCEEHISVSLWPFRKLLKLQNNGLILLGNVDGESWRSMYGDGYRSKGDFEKAARRWARFGYSDWLYERELADYLQS